MQSKPEKIFDAFTGEEFQPRVHNHYERNDGVPVAPPVDQPRLSLRERVERMLYSMQSGPEFISDGTPDDDFEEDDAEPLTQAEQAYVAQGAALERREAALLASQRTPPAQPSAAPASPQAPNPPSDGPGAAPPPGSSDARPPSTSQ